MGTAKKLVPLDRRRTSEFEGAVTGKFAPVERPKHPRGFGRSPQRLSVLRQRRRPKRLYVCSLELEAPTFPGPAVATFLVWWLLLWFLI